VPSPAETNFAALYFTAADAAKTIKEQFHGSFAGDEGGIPDPAPLRHLIAEVFQDRARLLGQSFAIIDGSDTLLRASKKIVKSVADQHAAANRLTRFQRRFRRFTGMGPEVEALGEIWQTFKEVQAPRFDSDENGPFIKSVKAVFGEDAEPLLHEMEDSYGSYLEGYGWRKVFLLPYAKAEGQFRPRLDELRKGMEDKAAAEVARWPDGQSQIPLQWPGITASQDGTGPLPFEKNPRLALELLQGIGNATEMKQAAKTVLNAAILLQPYAALRKEAFAAAIKTDPELARDPSTMFKRATAIDAELRAEAAPVVRSRGD
jgi:hypothetical protein